MALDQLPGQRHRALIGMVPQLVGELSSQRFLFPHVSGLASGQRERECDERQANVDLATK
jgi:hypothetical protein